MRRIQLKSSTHLRMKKKKRKMASIWIAKILTKDMGEEVSRGVSQTTINKELPIHQY
jgi:hypothetical protein